MTKLGSSVTEASNFDDARVVNYDRNMLKMQATGVNVTQYFFFVVDAREE
jgi:hypothetical protein